jgi:hypothetical protein
MRNPRLLALTAALCGALHGHPSALFAIKDAKDATKLDRLVGCDAIAILSNATRVEVFHLSVSSQQDREPGVGGYAISEKVKGKGREFAKRLAEALLRIPEYSQDGNADEHHFAPIVGLRLWEEKEYVEVILAGGYEVGIFTRDGKRHAYAAYGPSRAALVRLAKEALPGSKYVKYLKEE